ncbi:Heterogeneous nuclear ribonucleoprotein A1 [Trichinella sp. T8]|nr:Heterogeneous nuclear ribonucleoprotein A1 [Trichinella sp. T8]
MPAKVEKDEQNRKIFIGGITVNTSDEDLRTFYSKWGEITDVVVMRDPVSKRSRGFGFVTYADPEQVNAAMAARPHLIDGKEVEPKRAMPKDVMNKPEAHISVKKVYISGIKDEHTEDMLREYFMQYGSVQEVDIKVDQGTGKKRGFAFVTFDDYDPVDRVVLEKSHMIDNKRCDVKKALSKEEMKRIQQQDFDRQQRDARSRGMMRGGYTPNRSMGDMGMPYGGASSRWSGGHGGNMAGNHGGWADHSWGGSYGSGGGGSSWGSSAQPWSHSTSPWSQGGPQWQGSSYGSGSPSGSMPPSRNDWRRIVLANCKVRPLVKMIGAVMDKHCRGGFCYKLREGHHQ